MNNDDTVRPHTYESSLTGQEDNFMNFFLIRPIKMMQENGFYFLLFCRQRHLVHFFMSISRNWLTYIWGQLQGPIYFQWGFWCYGNHKNNIYETNTRNKQKPWFIVYKIYKLKVNICLSLSAFPNQIEFLYTLNTDWFWVQFCFREYWITFYASKITCYTTLKKQSH